MEEERVSRKKARIVFCRRLLKKKKRTDIFYKANSMFYNQQYTVICSSELGAEITGSYVDFEYKEHRNTTWGFRRSSTLIATPNIDLQFSTASSLVKIGNPALSEATAIMNSLFTKSNTKWRISSVQIDPLLLTMILIGCWALRHSRPYLTREVGYAIVPTLHLCESALHYFFI